jgi:hypothetical protein
VLLGVNHPVNWSWALSYIQRVASARQEAIKCHWVVSGISNGGEVAYDLQTGIIGKFWSGTELFSGLTSTGQMIAVKQYLKGFWSKRFIRFAVMRRGHDFGVRWEMGLDE